MDARAKFTVNVWGPGGWYITKRKHYRTILGAVKYAVEASQKVGVLEASITVKTKSGGRSVPRRVATYRKGEEIT